MKERKKKASFWSHRASGSLFVLFWCQGIFYRGKKTNQENRFKRSVAIENKKKSLIKLLYFTCNHDNLFPPIIYKLVLNYASIAHKLKPLVVNERAAIQLKCSLFFHTVK